MRAAAAFAIASLLATPAAAQNAPKVGDPPEKKDMALLGAHDLQARSAYQPIVHDQNGRWIAFIGHHGGTEAVPKPVNGLTGAAEFNGTSILDVTDPKAPKYLAHIHGEEGLGEQGGAQMVRWCPGRTLPKVDKDKFYLLRTFGNSAFHPKEIAYFIPPITEKTDKRCIKVDNADRCKVAIQTNNVEVDDRGYVYIVDRANTGLHILELTTEARKAANFPR